MFNRKGLCAVATMKTAFAAMMLLAALAAPAFAEHGKEGDVAVCSRADGVKQMKIASAVMLDEITKGVVPLDDHAMVVMNHGKFYLVLDHKMANGEMVSALLAQRGSNN